MRATWRGIGAMGAVACAVCLQATGSPRVAGQRPPVQRPSLQPVPLTQLEERLPAAAGQPFSLSFSEPISIRELLLVMVRDTPFSLVIEPGVDGTFVGELKNVTLPRALELALAPLALHYAIEDNTIRVFKPLCETRIFHVDYVATRRSATRRVGAGTGTNGPGSAATGDAPGRSAGGSQASVESSDATDLFADLQAGLQMLLSPDGRSNIDRKAGLVQVTDYPDRLARVALYLETVETRVTRQVQIQAKVIEVELATSYATGIDWARVLERAGDSVALTEGVAPAGGTGTVTLGVQLRDESRLLAAFGAQGTVNVLSSPRVVAMNNEPAVMRVGTEDIFFVTTSALDAATGRVVRTTMAPQSVTEGVVLSVTPQISADGIISMSISPTITDRIGQETSRLGDRVPIVSIRQTDTLVRVHEGETVVIAGLIGDRVIGGGERVPVLGHVPLLGRLFGTSDGTTRKTELVILLTPTSVSPRPAAEAGGKQIGGPGNRTDRFDR